MFAHPNKKKIFVYADIIFHLEFLPPFLLFSTKWVLILVYWKKSDACYLQKERKFLMFKHMYVDEILLIIFIRLLNWWLLPFRCILLVNLIAVIVHWVWIWYQSAICLCFPCLSAVGLVTGLLLTTGMSLFFTLVLFSSSGSRFLFLILFASQLCLSLSCLPFGY